MTRGGVDLGLLEEVQWRRTDDLGFWSLEPLAVFVRPPTARASVAHQIGSLRGVVLPPDPART
jgi:hypothetical protein